MRGSAGTTIVSDFSGTGGDRVLIVDDALPNAVTDIATLLAFAAETADGSAIFTLQAGLRLRLSGVRPAEIEASWFGFA